MALTDYDAESTILIIGAGATGLVLAQGLKKAGINAIVFEKYSSLSRSRDWNMGVHWGASYLRELLPAELWARIESVHVNPHEPVKEQDVVQFLYGKTGEFLWGLDVPKFYRLVRSKLRALLAEGLDVRFDKELKEFRDEGKGVVATFKDGTEVAGRMLVGADGAKSTVRTLLLGPELASVRSLPYSATFVQTRYPADRAKYLLEKHLLYLAAAHEDHKFGFYGMHDLRDPADASTWTTFFYISWPASLEELKEMETWSNEQHLAKLKELSKDFCDPWKSAIEWLPENETVWYMNLTDWDPGAEGHRWDNHGGRVTLVGDAAHVMTYQRGQGLNQSLADAGKLVETVSRFLKDQGGEAQASAVNAFEDELVARTGGEVRLSTENTAMLHDWDKLQQSPIWQHGVARLQRSKG